MNLAVAVRAALVQGLSVALVAVVLGTSLPDSFFASWGAIAGPSVWAACALLTATVLRLPRLRVLAGAVLAGLASLVLMPLAGHWAPAPLALVLMAAWCGRLAARRRGPAPAP